MLIKWVKNINIIYKTKLHIMKACQLQENNSWKRSDKSVLNQHKRKTRDLLIISWLHNTENNVIIKPTVIGILVVIFY